MDYRKLFTWNPAYTTFSQKVVHRTALSGRSPHTKHREGHYTDDHTEWVSTSVLRKNLDSSVFPT